MKRILMSGAAAAAITGMCAASPAAAAQKGAAGGHTLLVVKSSDDGSVGTLRWAITQADAGAGGDTIVIERSVGVIRLSSVLPAITEPVTIEGQSDSRGLPTTGIDGSAFIDTSTMASCPGWTSGSGPNVRSITSPGFAVVDTGDVRITNLVERNLCIGILSLRSHDNAFTSNLVQNDIGAAGIEVTGDDGQGNSTTGVSVRNLVAHNTFIDDGDDMEFTRGTAYSTAEDNTYLVDARPPAGFLPSQTIEFAGDGDNDNRVIDNRMLGGMSDGLQLSGSDNLVEGNEITGEANAIDAGGTDSTIVANTITGNHQGIVGKGTGITINRNSIYDQGQPISECNAGGICSTNSTYDESVLGIDLGAPGPTPNDPGDTDGIQNYPVLTSVTEHGQSAVVTGTLSSSPNGAFRIELFADSRPGAFGYGEGQRYLGAVTVHTDATGTATFTAHETQIPSGWQLSATATNLATGSTSEFSADLATTTAR